MQLNITFTYYSIRAKKGEITEWHHNISFFRMLKLKLAYNILGYSIHIEKQKAKIDKFADNIFMCNYRF